MHYGIDDGLLNTLWVKYQRKGPSALVKKKYIHADGALKEKIVRDIQENFLTLYEASVKYDVSTPRLSVWLRTVREKGYLALYEYKKTGRHSKDMGRPKKKKPEEMTELERLRYENECLRTENALLKKVRALVEERNAHLCKIEQKPSKN
jgi:transposase-like protein